VRRSGPQEQLAEAPVAIEWVEGWIAAQVKLKVEIGERCELLEPCEGVLPVRERRVRLSQVHRRMQRDRRVRDGQRFGALEQAPSLA
jgi:hypothetical protein